MTVRVTDKQGMSYPRKATGHILLERLSVSTGVKGVESRFITIWIRGSFDNME